MVHLESYDLVAYCGGMIHRIPDPRDSWIHNSFLVQVLDGLTNGDGTQRELDKLSRWNIIEVQQRKVSGFALGSG